MERQVNREQKISAFEIDLGDLEALLQRIINLFNDKSKVFCTIDIPLNKERLSFESVQELRDYGSLKGKIDKFSINVTEFGGKRRIFIHCYDLFSSNATVSATAESEAWCAGAIETIVTFLHSRRVWYHWFIDLPFFSIGFFVLVIFLLLKDILNLDLYINKSLIYSLISVSIVLIIFSMRRSYFLPSAILKITNEEGFFKKWSSALTLLISIIALVFTVIGWFVGK